MKTRHFMDNLDDSQKNWEVAKALGWTGKGPEEGPWFDENGQPKGSIPDFCNDLNATFMVAYRHTEHQFLNEAKFIVEEGGVKSIVETNGSESHNLDGTVTRTEEIYHAQGFCTAGDSEKDSRRALCVAMCIAYLKFAGIIEKEGCC